MPALHPPGHHRAPPRDREHVLHRHQKRPVDRPLGLRNVAVQRIGQLHDRPLAHLPRVALQRLQRRADHDRGLVPGKLVLGQELPHLHLHQLQQLLVIDHVRLVHEHHDVGHPHLARQQNVLARLRHRPVGRRHHQDRPVHLRRPGDHVLDVVRMPRAVHVRVVALGRLVLHVRRVDRDPARLLLRRRINLVVGLRLPAELLRQHQRHRRRQRRLAMVHVPYRPHVHVRLGPLKFAFCHDDDPCRYGSDSDWCRWCGLNARPLPYQGSALPLSYMGEAKIWSG